jgi:5-methyltetrahydropteroyltriglutamate--homocysteine methyltransferase
MIKQTSFPPIPTTVVGSYSLPKWLDVVRDDYQKGRLTQAEYVEAHDNAVKSCIKDHERAGVDIITDGELRRETMVYFFSKRMDGFDMAHPRMKAIGDLDPSIQMPDPVITGPIRRKESLGMADHFRFLKENTIAHPKLTCTGPQMLVKRATNEFYADEKEAVFDAARVLNHELKECVAAGCDYIQIDEPVWVGYPRDIEWLVKAFNHLVDGLKVKLALHICYGNYQLKRLFKGQYEELFPQILNINAHQLSMEFAVSDGVGLDLFRRYSTQKEVVVGVIDVKDERVETPEVVALRIRRALEYIPVERLYVSPDCGMKFMPRDRAFAKLKAMVEGARLVRKELRLE